MNREKNFISAVVYVHNAEDRVGDFVKTVVRVLEENFDHSEVICVNDDSSDGSLIDKRPCDGAVIHLASIPPGVYLIKAEGYNGSETKKLVVK